MIFFYIFDFHFQIFTFVAFNSIILTSTMICSIIYATINNIFRNVDRKKKLIIDFKTKLKKRKKNNVTNMFDKKFAIDESKN